MNSLRWLCPGLCILMSGCSTLTNDYGAEMGQAADIATTLPNLAMEANPIVAAAPAVVLPAKLILPKVTREMQVDQEGCEDVNNAFGRLGWDVGLGWNGAILAAGGAGGPAALAAAVGGVFLVDWAMTPVVERSSERVCAHKPKRTAGEQRRLDEYMEAANRGPFNSLYFSL